MALDSIRKRKIEESEKIDKKKSDIRSGIEDLKNLIDSLPSDEDIKISDDTNEITHKSDIDIKKIKEDEKREFSYTSNQKNNNSTDNSITQSFEPFVNTSSQNNDKIPNLKNIEKFVTYSKELQNKHGMYYKAFMSDVEKEKFIKLLSDAYGYSREKIDEDLDRYVNDIKNNEDYNKILNSKFKQKINELEKIKRLKIQLDQLNLQIIELISYFEPYMNIPKVNEQISIIINKNNDINHNPIIDSINDYNTIIEIKKEMINYLEKAKGFIDSKTKQNNTYEEQDGHSYGFINVFIVLSLLAITLITFVIF